MKLSTDELKLVAGLLDDLLELSAELRPGWIATLSEEHPRLRELLARLPGLDPVVSTGALLGAMPTLPARGAIGRPGDRIGPYRLLHEIGHGAMGAVWRAERVDGHFSRVVALKLPRADWDPSLATRLVMEAKLGARLEHPGISRLYEAGVDNSGRPYLAMEFVDGQPLDVWCRAQSAPIEARTMLMSQVARAVGYAHRRGVVHRDIKPSNVLVSPDGQPHLLDFGIARAVDGTAEINDHPSLLNARRTMTPRYAAPEQLLGQAVTTSVDIFSLGLLTYEVLVGRSPFEDLDRLDANGEPRPVPRASDGTPSRSLARRLRGDLDAILCQALQRDPSSRYSTADALADDLDRYARGEPVQARHGGMGYRLTKWAARRRWSVGIGSLALVSSLGSAGALWWAESQSFQAAERSALAAHLVGELFKIQSEVPRSSLVGSDTPQEDALSRATQALEAALMRQPALQAEVHGAIGRSLLGIGASKQALSHAQRQFDLLTQLDADEGERAKAGLLLARALQEAGALDRALEALQRVTPGLHADAESLMEARATHALLLIQLGHVDAAWRLVDFMQQEVSRSGEPAGIGPALLTYARARQLEGENRFDESVGMLERAIARAKSVEGAGSRRAIGWRLVQAMGLIDRHRADEAKSLFSEVLAATDGGPGLQRMAAIVASMTYWHRISEMSGVPDEVLDTELSRLQQRLDELGPLVPEIARARMAFTAGATWKTRGDLVRGRRQMQPVAHQLLRATESLAQQWHVAAHMGDLEMNAGSVAQAHTWLARRREIRKQMGRGSSPFAAYDWALMARNLAMGGQFDAAREVLRNAPDFGAEAGDRRAGGAYRRLLVEVQAFVDIAQGRYAQAEQRLTSYDGQLAPEAANTSDLGVRAMVGEIRCATGRPREGLSLIIAVLNDLEPFRTPHAPSVARLRALAGQCEWALGHRREAQAWAARSRTAIDLQPQVSGWYKEPLRQLEAQLGQTMTSHRRPSASIGQISTSPSL